jgi:hypothetical protein
MSEKPEIQMGSHLPTVQGELGLELWPSVGRLSLASYITRKENKAHTGQGQSPKCILDSGLFSPGSPPSLPQ